MVLVAHMAVEVLPEAEILAQSTVTAARHITQNAIELEILPFAALLHVWELACVIVSDQKGWQVEFGCLMGKHEGSL